MCPAQCHMGPSLWASQEGGGDLPDSRLGCLLTQAKLVTQIKREMGASLCVLCEDSMRALPSLAYGSQHTFKGVPAYSPARLESPRSGHRPETHRNGLSLVMVACALSLSLSRIQWACPRVSQASDYSQRRFGPQSLKLCSRTFKSVS